MPFSLLVAILLAFGIDLRSDSGPLSADEVQQRIGLTAAGALGLAVVAISIGATVAFLVRRREGSTPAIRRFYALGCRSVEVFSLLIYAWIIHVVDWTTVVESGFGLRDTILVDEFLILLPFLLMQVLSWWGLYWGERALRPIRLRVGQGRYLALRARQALGLVLPVAAVFSLGQDVFRRQWPQWVENQWVQIGWMTAMGILVLILAPAFVRLTWPTRPLPPGPLRDRLERLSRRFGFRCTDILIWETGQGVVNAGVTGALPYFRYVLLTDALVEHLDEHQVEAVFGHEVGHISHHHLTFFGFFLLGSVVGVLALVSSALTWLAQSMGWSTIGATWLGVWGINSVVQVATIVICLGVYGVPMFGFLSRRFERQADVFGCRAVSCGRADCPPHSDLNAVSEIEGPPQGLCSAGIRIFASALSDVAALNGMERETWWAWRHGSITRRIAFLEGLEGRPQAERRFQRSVKRLRVALAVAMLSAVSVAAATGAIAH